MEVSVALSYICSREIREKILVPIYLSFLKDPLKYVSDLALIALGPFIASFANSEGSEYHQMFNEVLMNNIYNFNYGPINFSLSNANFRDDFVYDIVPDYNDTEANWYPDSNFDFKYRSAYARRGNDFMFDSKLAGEDGKRGLTAVSLDDEPDEEADEAREETSGETQDEEADEAKNEFNSFNYWREPIMSIDELLDADENSGSDQEKDEDRRKSDDYLHKLFNNKRREEDTMATNIEKCLKLLKDNVVPDELLFYFLKNLLSNYGSNIYQADINCICAFSLPAVALTLGRENWPCLRFAFNVLVIGMSTNIKLILASSLHELAKIVGPVYTNLDILPALFTFMRHNDEIRERILKNLSPLVNSFEKNDQNKILRKLPSFYKLDNEYNWRFRVDFIKQFIELVPLYDKQKQFSQTIMPMIFSLLEDKVAEVRKCSIPLLTATIQHFYDASKKVLVSGRLKESILDQVQYKLCQSKKWTFRQLYILICENIMQSAALPVETFREKLLPPLLALAKDKVINVRLTLARVLASELVQKYFESGLNDLDATIELLAGDEDKDVRSFFVTPSKEEEAALNKENRLYKFDDLQMKISRDLFFDEQLWNSEKSDEKLNSLGSIFVKKIHVESGDRSYGDSALIGSDELLSKHVSSELNSEVDHRNELESDLDSSFGSDLSSGISNDIGMDVDVDNDIGSEISSDISSGISNDIGSDITSELSKELTTGETGGELTNELAISPINELVAEVNAWKDDEKLTDEFREKVEIADEFRERTEITDEFREKIENLSISIRSPSEQTVDSGIVSETASEIAMETANETSSKTVSEATSETERETPSKQASVEPVDGAVEESA